MNDAKIDKLNTSIHPDGLLLDMCGQFWAAEAVYAEASQASVDLRARADADPNCPSIDSYDDWQAFMRDRGVWAAYDASNEAHKRIGSALRAVFGTPAETVVGAAAKARILALVEGQHGEGDDNLTAWEEPRGAWLDDLVCDLDRLAEEGGAS